MIKPYLVDIINNHKIKEWKIQLLMTINFISSKDSDEIPAKHTRSNNIKIMMVNKTIKLLKNFLNLFCKNIKKDQEKK